MLRSSFIVIAALALLSGCSDEKRYADDDYDDIATAIGTLVGTDSTGETASMEDAVGIATGTHSEHLAEIGEGTFECQRAGLTYSYDVECEDESGRKQRVCGDATDLAKLGLAWNGSLDLASYDADVERSGTWIISGLSSRTAVFTGSGNFDVVTEFTGLSRPIPRNFELDYAATYEDVSYDRVDAQFSSGTIHYDVSALRTVTRDGERSETPIDVTVDVTFVGDGTAIIDVDGVREYDLDLSSGRVEGETASDIM